VLSVPMLSVDEARTRIVAPLRPTQAEVVALAEAWGRVTAAPVVARLTQPPMDVSAMDGYALRAADGAVGAVLHVIGEAPAGRPLLGEVGVGQAVRLFTGSAVPAGADCVVAQEDVAAEGDAMRLTAQAQAGRHIRRAGQDFRVGNELLPAGVRLGARGVGLAAAANYPWLAVHRRPRVAILATGDEIAMPGDPLTPGGIVSSNAHSLAALVRGAGGDPLVLPIARDTRAAVAEAVQALGGVDLLVTTGGASVGDYDLVQSGLGEHGFVLDFWRIAMRPGKPLLFGTLRGIPVLGLPGNPVSALVCAVLFLLPALARLSGLPGEAVASSMMALGTAVGANDQRQDYMRASIAAGPDGQPQVSPFSRQDSSLLWLLARADGLVVRPPHAPALPAGAPVPVVRLDLLGL
jgi:molybdopterin molybdotransferase